MRKRLSNSVTPPNFVSYQFIWRLALAGFQDSINLSYFQKTVLQKSGYFLFLECANLNRIDNIVSGMQIYYYAMKTLVKIA